MVTEDLILEYSDKIEIYLEGTLLPSIFIDKLDSIFYPIVDSVIDRFFTISFSESDRYILYYYDLLEVYLVKEDLNRVKNNVKKYFHEKFTALD